MNKDNIGFALAILIWILAALSVIAAMIIFSIALATRAPTLIWVSVGCAVFGLLGWHEVERYADQGD